MNKSNYVTFKVKEGLWEEVKESCNGTIRVQDWVNDAIEIKLKLLKDIGLLDNVELKDINFGKKRLSIVARVKRYLFYFPCSKR